MRGKAFSLAFLLLASVALAGTASAQGLTPLEQLGKHLFFDKALSTPGVQSCATCHEPATGFVSPEAELGGFYHGAVEVRFGNRKVPPSAYAGDSPVLYYDTVEEAWIGGMFWDGRATGWALGDPLAEQALGPYLNPLEQNNPNARSVILKVARSEYADLFEQVWGPGSLDFVDDVAGTYERIGRSVAAYERSSEVNPFTSKYDYYLAGQAQLTADEALGLSLFNAPSKGNCAACHPSTPGPGGEPPLFTDFTYDNLGLPKNPDNPFYLMPRKWNPAGRDWVDYGLGGFLAEAGYPQSQTMPEMGKHKVPTLRNVDLRPDPAFVKNFGHNGFFESLKDIVHFYNTRDLGGWPPPEVPMNVNTTELGNLGLTSAEEDAIVAFLRTLSDGYQP